VYTKDLIDKLHKESPLWNFMVVHTKHTAKFEGKELEDWKHTKSKFKAKIGLPVKYDIYQFKGGEFWLKGQGGYLNVSRGPY
jgi:hypothetical protein